MRADLFPALRRELFNAGLLKDLPTFVFFAVAYAFRFPYAHTFELLAVAVVAVAGTGYFIAREFEAASSWWSTLVATFPTGISGFAEPERLVVPALNLSIPWETVRPIVTGPDGFVLATAAGTLPLHASMVTARSDWDVLCSWLVAGLERRAG